MNTVPVGMTVRSSFHLWTALFHLTGMNGPTYCHLELIPVPTVPCVEIPEIDDSSYR